MVLLPVRLALSSRVRSTQAVLRTQLVSWACQWQHASILSQRVSLHHQPFMCVKTPHARELAINAAVK